MSGKIVFVNNPAATSGGALTILKQFIENVAKVNKEYLFYVFCTKDLSEYNSDNIIIVNNINAKSWKNRIVWDIYGLKKWSKVNRVTPNLIISLQNTGIYGFRKIPQTVYIHQSIPYYKDIKWSVWNKYERNLWFYKNIYKYLIGVSIRNCNIIVQTKWMKCCVSKTHNIDSNKIEVIKPSISNISLNNIEQIRKDDEKILFYPAIGAKYKNHKVIIDAINLLAKEVRLKVIFTIDQTSGYGKEIYNYVKYNNVEQYVSFVGKLEYKDVLKYYSICDIVVYPSYIETYGLPLIESAILGKSILASDLEYAREALEDYNGVRFINCHNAEKWVEGIKLVLENKAIKYEYKNKEINSWNHLVNIIRRTIG